MDGVRKVRWNSSQFGLTPDDISVPDDKRMERLLCRYGGGFFMADDRARGIVGKTELPMSDVAGTGEAETVCRKLLAATADLDCKGVCAVVRMGARVDAKDGQGRNLVRIALDDSKVRYREWAERVPEGYRNLLTNFVLFLLGHMKVPMEAEDWRWLAEKCRAEGETELLAELEESPLFGERFRAAVGGRGSRAVTSDK